MKKHKQKSKTRNSNNANAVLADSYLPSELMALKEYYDKVLLANSNNGGCSSISHKQILEAKTISENIGKKLWEMANNFR